jgi:succinate-semialdehyde dehydrogenase/glutarate-semialdehyde dehydrogenase
VLAELEVPRQDFAEAVGAVARKHLADGALACAHDPGVPWDVAGLLAGHAVNGWQVSLAETPFGGVGESGVGYEGGVEGLRAFQRVKSVLVWA